MPPIPPQPVQLTCPVCNANFRTNIYTIMDVTQQPELKQALLSGQLNLAVCPSCSAASMIGAPLLYHDAQKQLCLVYFPQEINAPPEEQERFIGEATNALLHDLPPSVSRGYLLTPRRFMSLASLIDAVLEADGIPREVLEQQRKRVDLISQLASALEDEEQLTRLVEQHKEDLNYEFFTTLSAFIEASSQEQRNESVQMLSLLHDRLVELTNFSGDGAEEDADLDEVIERLVSVSDAELEEVIAEVRPAIDYSFFQAWTNRIEALEGEGQHEEAQRLTSRRAQILEIVEQMDKDAQAMFEAGAEILREVLTAPDTVTSLRNLGNQIDETFLLVLSANIAAAQRAGQTELVARMEEIGQIATELIQERLSPEERFINELILAETPQESTKLLRQNAAKVTPDFVKQLNELADDQESHGSKPHAERLRQLAREAGAMLF